jgi:N-acetylneuraminate synthase
MFLIAELSCSHLGSIQRALDTIDILEGDAVKLQTWTPGTMAVPYKIKKGPWKGWDLPKLYERAHTPWDWHMRLFEKILTKGMVPISTPFDRESVDFLESLECPIYKIASYEMTDLRLISYVAQTGKPMIISTGMARTFEIRAAVKTAREYCRDLTLLHCVSEYPTSLEDVNLKTMPALKRFGCNIGLSDHSVGSTVAIAAAALGAQVIEKHVGLSAEGFDKDFAMLPRAFNKMCDDVRDVETALGSIKFGQGDDSLRRSLYFARDLKAGDVIKDDDIITRRPNKGVSPINLNKVLGATLKENVSENDTVRLRRLSIPT